MKYLSNNLVNWYKENKREFPWRNTADPYYIWISEIMLQQTGTETVIPYYNRFIERFPTINDLAKADEDTVYKLWQGLGYYRRAKHLYLSAKIIMDQYNGIFPVEYKDILALKGIGTYTAGAICSIAYNQPYAAVDGNVLRIFSRLKDSKDNIALESTKKKIQKDIEDILIHTESSLFNQALMDLGALICKPRKPQCDICPIAKYCMGYRNNHQNIIPVNIKNIKRSEHHYITGIIKYKNKYMLIRNKEGLLENLYGFIQYDAESPFTFIQSFYDEYKISIKPIRYINTIRHVFTHKTWIMSVYEFELDEPSAHLYNKTSLEQLAISTAHLKVYQAYQKSKEF